MAKSGRAEKSKGVTVQGDGPLAGAVRAQGGAGAARVLLIDHGDDARTIAALPAYCA